MFFTVYLYEIRNYRPFIYSKLFLLTNTLFSSMQLNFLTLVEVCMEYKNDIDGAADYIIHNVLPSIPDNNDAHANEGAHMKSKL